MENILMWRPLSMLREHNSSLLVGSQEQREFSHGSVPAWHLLRCALAVNVRWKVKARATLCQKAFTSPGSSMGWSKIRLLRPVQGPTWDQLNQKPDVSRVCAVTFVLLQKCVLWVPRVQSKTEFQVFCAVHFLTQDTGFLFLRSTFFFPKLQTPVSLGVIFNSCSCLYYTTHALEQEVTSLPMHW